MFVSHTTIRFVSKIYNRPFIFLQIFKRYYYYYYRWYTVNPIVFFIWTVVRNIRKEIFKIRFNAIRFLLKKYIYIYYRSPAADGIYCIPNTRSSVQIGNNTNNLNTLCNLNERRAGNLPNVFFFMILPLVRRFECKIKFSLAIYLSLLLF